MFDAIIYSSALSDDTLDNLAYFGTTHALLALTPTPAKNTKQLLHQTQRLLDIERQRCQHVGIDARAIIGVQPGCTPSRAHPELWPALEAHVQNDMCVGVGPLSIDPDDETSWSLFERQVHIASRTGRALILTPPKRHVLNHIYKMLQVVEKANISPERCFIRIPSPNLLSKVIDEGAIAIADLRQDAWTHPVELPRKDIERAQLMLASTLNHSIKHPILLPKWLAALQKTEMATHLILKIGRAHGLAHFF